MHAIPGPEDKQSAESRRTGWRKAEYPSGLMKDVVRAVLIDEQTAQDLAWPEG